MQTVLITAPYMIPHMERFGPILKKYDLDLIIPEVNERFSEEEILKFAGQFDGTICGDDQYTSRVIEACSPRLKIISKWGTGIDSIDQDAAAKYGVKVGNTPNAFSVPVSESVLGYMLAFARQLPWLDDAMKAGQWRKYPGKSLSECVLGVIGVGNVGKAVIRRARQFGMKLLGNDIIEIAPEFLLENLVEMTDLQDLMSRADFISINCTLNPTSYHLINDETLAYCKPEAVVINVARGPIIQEAALIKALEQKKIRGAALDVFEVEPLPQNSPLIKMENVMLAPHNSNSSPYFWEGVQWNTIRNLLLGLGLDANTLEKYKGTP
ncbi:MAG: phosphoglycerate dehydrogenase [Anaerolineaceae bacterium]|nr:phosphoglycerate dehydrogenase [Anaerolineaceae bacterium]